MKGDTILVSPFYFNSIMHSCQKDQSTHGRCCCNCKYHLEDLYHCTTIDRIQFAVDNNVKAPDGCVCSLHKGWICSTPIGSYSDWTAHGLCEMHEFGGNYDMIRKNQQT
jgi:hypothetical protein